VRISVSYSCSETMQDLFHSKPAIQQSFQWNQDAQDIDSKGMTVKASWMALQKIYFNNRIDPKPKLNQFHLGTQNRLDRRDPSSSVCARFSSDSHSKHV
jgi:hypothetical protein